MLRVACILIREQGIDLCAPIHDAILIEADDALIHKHSTIAQQCMTQASGVVLGGFELSSDLKTLNYPDRFLDNDAEPFWTEMIDLLKKVETQPMKTLTPSR